jgi:hypothetical protein
VTVREEVESSRAKVTGHTFQLKPYRLSLRMRKKPRKGRTLV